MKVSLNIFLVLLFTVECCYATSCMEGGTYLNLPSETFCTQCESGKYNEYNGVKGWTSCSVCVPGKYQSNLGSTYCKDCDRGSYSNVAIGSTCQTCPSGQTTYDITINMIQNGMTYCSFCPDGKHISASKTCVSCVSGETFCKNGYEQICSTPVDKYEYVSQSCKIKNDAIVLPCSNCSISEYATSVCGNGFDTQCSKCSTCLNNEYVFSECKGGKDTVCSQCDISAGDMVPGIGICNLCLPGSILSAQKNDCVLCTAGTYSATPNTTSCHVCPNGLISSVGASRCVKKCDDGYYAPNGEDKGCVNITFSFKPITILQQTLDIQVSSSAMVSPDHFLLATKKPFNYASEILLMSPTGTWSVAGNPYYTSNIVDGKGEYASFALITSISSNKNAYLLTEYDVFKNKGYLRWFSLVDLEGEARQLNYSPNTVINWIRPEEAVYDMWQDLFIVMDIGMNALVQLRIDETTHTVTFSKYLISSFYREFNPISFSILQYADTNEGEIIILDNNKIISMKQSSVEKTLICGGGWKVLKLEDGGSLPCDEVDFSASGAKRVLLTVIDDMKVEDSKIVYILLTSTTSSTNSAIALIDTISMKVKIAWVMSTKEDTVVTNSYSLPLQFISVYSALNKKPSGLLPLSALYMVESKGIISRIYGGIHSPNNQCICDPGLFCDINTKQCLDAPLGTYALTSELLTCPERTVGVKPGGSDVNTVCKVCPIGFNANQQKCNCKPSCDNGGVYENLTGNCLMRCDGMYLDPIHGKCLECWLGSEATGGHGIESCIACSAGKYGKIPGVCDICALGTTTRSDGSTVCMPDSLNNAVTVDQKICADGLSVNYCPIHIDIPQNISSFINNSHNILSISGTSNGMMYAFTSSPSRNVYLVILDTVSSEKISYPIITSRIDIFKNLQVCETCQESVIFHAATFGTCIYKTSFFKTVEVFKGNCDLEGQPANGLLPVIHSMTLMETDTVTPVIFISTITSKCAEVLTISTYDGSVTYFASQDALKYPSSLLNTCIVTSLILESSKGANAILYTAVNDKLYATETNSIFLNDGPIFQVGDPVAGMTLITALAIQHQTFNNQLKHHIIILTNKGNIHSIPVSAYTLQYQVTNVVSTLSSKMDDILLIGRRVWYVDDDGSIQQILLSNVNGCIGGYVLPSTDMSIQGVCLQGGRGKYTDFNGNLQSCPSGTFGVKAGASLLVQCLPCLDGTIAPNAGHAFCQPCPPGSFADPLKMKCIDICPLGTYRVLNSCVACQPGYTIIRGSCLPCEEGMYSDASTSWQCSTCPLGYTSPKGAHNCVRICTSPRDDTCALDGEHCISLSKQYKVLSQIYTSNTGQQMIGLAVDKIGGVFYTNGNNIRYYFDDCPSYSEICNKEGNDLLQSNKYSEYSFSALAICDVPLVGCSMYYRKLYISSLTYSSVFILQVCQDGNGKIDFEATLAGDGLTLLAGSRWAGFADGPFASAMFNQPADLEINTQCNLLYLTDFFNHKIRLLNITSGLVTTVAGSGKPCWKMGDAHCNAADVQQGCSNSNNCASIYYPVGIGLSLDEKDLYIAANNVNSLVKLTNGETLAYTCKFSFSSRMVLGGEEKCDLNAPNSKGCMLFRAFDVVAVTEHEMYVGVTQGITKIYSEDGGSTYKCQQIAGNYFDIYTSGLRDGILPSTTSNSMQNSLVNIPYKMAFSKERGVLYFADFMNGAVRRVMVKNACVCPIGSFLLPNAASCYNPSPTWSKKPLPTCQSGYYALEGDMSCYRKCAEAEIATAPCLTLPSEPQFSSLTYSQLLGDIYPPHSSLQADWYGTVSASFMYSWNSIFKSSATYRQGKIPGKAPFGRNFITVSFSLVSQCWYEETKFELYPQQILPGLWFPCQTQGQTCTCSDAITSFEKLPSSQSEKDALQMAPKRWQALRDAASMANAGCKVDGYNDDCSVKSRSMFMIFGSPDVSCDIEGGPCFPELIHKSRESSSQIYQGLGYTLHNDAKMQLSCYIGWPAHFYCPNGYIWITPTSFKTCNTISNQITCMSCMPGTFAFLESTEKEKTGGPYTCQKCNQGTYSSAVGSSTCLACPEGKYSSYLGASYCEACAPGKYTVVPRAYSSSQCVNCLPGTGNCSGCVMGTYQNSGGEIRCLLTPPGFYTSEINASVPTACSPGYYQGSIGQSSCFKCSYGSFTNGYAATACILCNSTCPMTIDNICGKGCGINRFWNGKMCVICPKGTMNSYEICAMDAEYCWQNPRKDYYFSSQTQEIYQCPHGSEANGNFDGCTFCEKGYFSDGSTRGCKTCSQGTFSNVINSTFCLQCEVGKSNNEERNEKCDPCIQGTFSPSKGALNCIACPAGRYSNILGSSLCELCTFGKFNNVERMSTCNETCDADIGYYSLPGDTNCRYCDGGIINVSLSCQGCGLGQYLSSNDENRSCMDCPTGTVNLIHTAATNDSVCIRCLSLTAYAVSNLMCIEASPGFIPNAINNGQIPCPVGTYRNTTLSYCIACPKGTYNDINGREKCSDCIPGKYSAVEGKETCSSCPSGSISKEPASTSCQACPAGSRSVNGNNCSLCIENTYSYQDGQFRCLSCSQTTYSNIGATACSYCPEWKVLNLQKKCDLCSPGKYMVVDAYPLYKCLACRPGKYISYASGGDLCVACSPGTVALNEGTDQCTSCPLGQYADSTTSCNQCERGTYSDKGLGCIECMPGTFGLDRGLSGCLSCANGHYQDSHGQVDCRMCPQGTFSNTSGNTACMSCMLKYDTFTNMPGQTYCIQKKTYCDVGQYLNRSGSTTEDHNCVVCKPCAANQLTIILNKFTGTENIILYNNQEILAFSSQVCDGYGDAPSYQCVDNTPRAGEYLSFDTPVGDSGSLGSVAPFNFKQCQNPKYNTKMVTWVSGMDIKQCYLSCLYGIVSNGLKTYTIKYSGNNQNVEDIANNIFLERMLDNLEGICLPCPLLTTCPRGRFRPRGSIDPECGPTCAVPPLCSQVETVTGCTAYCTNAPPNADYVAGTQELGSNDCAWICNPGWHLSDTKTLCNPCPDVQMISSDMAMNLVGSLCGSNDYVVLPKEQCLYWHTSHDLCKPCPHIANGKIVGWNQTIELCNYQCLGGYFMLKEAECVPCTQVNWTLCPIGTYLDQESCFLFGFAPVCKPCLSSPGVSFTTNGVLNATKCKGICSPGFHTLSKSTGVYFTSMNNLELLPFAIDAQCVQCTPNDQRSCLRSNASICFDGYYRNQSIEADQIGSCVPCKQNCLGYQYPTLCTGKEIVDASCMQCPQSLLMDMTQQYTTKQFISYADIASISGQSQLQVISREYCPRVCLNNFARDPSNLDECITCKSISFALQLTLDPTKISNDNQCVPLGTPACSFIFSHWNATPAIPWWDQSQTPWFVPRQEQRAGLCWPCPDGTTTAVKDNDLCTVIAGYISPSELLPIARDPIPSLPADVSVVWKRPPIFKSPFKKSIASRRLLVDLSNITKTTNSVAKACPHGYYKPSTGGGGCFACPIGSSTVSEGSVSKDSCMCKYGYYRTNIGIQNYFCSPCPSETYGNTSVSVTSSLKKTSEKNTTFWHDQCTPCPPNQTTYGNEGSTNCVCALGMIMDPKTNECSLCPEKYFCQPCDNISCLTEGIKMYPCFSDAYSPIGSYGIENCTCPVGKIKKSRPRNPSQFYCQSIPMGGEVNPMSGEIVCKKGWTTVSKAEDGSVTECTLCPLGNYASTMQQNILLTSNEKPLCIPCPIGFYLSSKYGIGVESCTFCPSNQTTRGTGAASLQECFCPLTMKKDPIRGICIGCTPTQYVDPMNNTLCKDCPLNSVTETGANECMCNAGYYSLYTSTKYMRCVLCPMGTFSAYASTNGECTQCPDGSTTYRSGSTRLSSCGENQALCNSGYSWRMGVGCFKHA